MRSQASHTTQNVFDLMLLTATAPLGSFCIDNLGALVRTALGQCYLVVITERLKPGPQRNTARSHCGKKSRNISGPTGFCYGRSLDHISENDRQFKSKLFQDVCKIRHVHKSLKTLYHPKTNHQVESFKRTVLYAFRTYILDHPRDWDS